MDRVKKAKGKHLLQYFDYKIDSTKFDLVVAVHPDGATDHAILSDLPGIIVPCCPIPSAVKWEFKKDGWIKHLKSLTSRTVTEKQLPFRGANIALIIR
jgi:hypothetical protein